MPKLKKLSISILIATGSVALTAQNLPTAYEVIDLGALETVNSTPSSFGYDINDNGIAVGSSVGAQKVSNEVNGVVTFSDIDVLKAVDFNDLNRELMPPDREFGFNDSSSGMFATSIDQNNVIGGYGYSTEEVLTVSDTLNENGDVTVECGTEDIQSKSRTTGFYFDNSNTLSLIPNFIRIGQPLDENGPTEYTSTSVLGSNTSYLVGWASKVNGKDDCNNVSSEVMRGMIYDLQTGEVRLLGTFVPENSELRSSSFSFVRAINASNEYVGSTEALDTDGNKVIRALIGNLETEEQLIVPGLDGSTQAAFWSINDLGTYAVGTSNKLDDARPVAFYYETISDTSIALGFLNQELPYSEAFSVNNDNIVVGTSRVSSLPESYEAFIYDIDAEQPEVINLNSLIDCDNGWKLAEARAINNNGWIVGSGVYTSPDTGESEVHAFLLKPRELAADQSCSLTAESESGSFGICMALLGLLGIRRRSV